MQLRVICITAVESLSRHLTSLPVNLILLCGPLRLHDSALQSIILLGPLHVRHAASRALSEPESLPLRLSILARNVLRLRNVSRQEILTGKFDIALRRLKSLRGLLGRESHRLKQLQVVGPRVLLVRRHIFFLSISTNKIT